VVDKNRVRVLKADWSDNDESISQLMDDLQVARALPLLVIFPAGRPNEPIIFSAGYTRKTLLASLEKAGASGIAQTKPDSKELANTSP
jgi:thiol:disulfide interchange protein